MSSPDLRGRRPLRVLVLGTNYGRAYVKAIRAAGDRYVLAGLLARGSARSQTLAKGCGVPLFRTAEGLPGDIDLACAAMGPAGTETVLHLLQRGIHLLCEHPQKSDFLRQAFLTASASGASFHVNGHFAALEAPTSFLAALAELKHRVPPIFLHVMTTDRALYAVLDILRRGLDSLTPLAFEVSGRPSPFVSLSGVLAGIPARVDVQCSGPQGNAPLEDGSQDYLLDFRITLFLATGILTLSSMIGPVLWHANAYRASDAHARLWRFVYGDESASRATLDQQRLSANLRAMDLLADCGKGMTAPAEQQPGYLLDVSRAWEEIGSKLEARDLLP